MFRCRCRPPRGLGFHWQFLISIIPCIQSAWRPVYSVNTTSFVFSHDSLCQMKSGGQWQIASCLPVQQEASWHAATRWRGVLSQTVAIHRCCRHFLVGVCRKLSCFFYLQSMNGREVSTEELQLRQDAGVGLPEMRRKGHRVYDRPHQGYARD